MSCHSAESRRLYAIDSHRRTSVAHARACIESRRGPGCTGAQSAAISVIPGVVFSGSVDGHLRAYSTTDGKIIWDFDTMRDVRDRQRREGPRAARSTPPGRSSLADGADELRLRSVAGQTGQRAAGVWVAVSEAAN